MGYILSVLFTLLKLLVDNTHLKKLIHGYLNKYILVLSVLFSILMHITHKCFEHINA